MDLSDPPVRHMLCGWLDEVRTDIGPGPRLSIAARKVQPVLPDFPVPVIDRSVSV